MEYKITLENLELQHELGEYILELEEEGKSPKTILNYKLLESVDREEDPRAYALFLFLFNTGARISEALSVDIERVEKVGNSYKVAIRGKRGGL